MMSSVYPHVCVLFAARSLEGFAGANHRRIARALSGLCDVYAIVHGETRQPLHDGVLVLDDDAIFKEVEHCKTSRPVVVPGNVDLLFVRACREISDYQFVIWWEYDVVCTLDIRSVVTRFIEWTGKTDLAASYYRKRCNIRKDKWVWWDTLHIPDAAPRQTRRMARGAFLPLFGASRRFIEGYATLLKQGWRGHTEVTMPTAVRYLSLRYRDMSKSRHRFTSYPQFTVTTPDRLERFMPSFVHPIKTEEAFSYVNGLRGGALGP